MRRLVSILLLVSAVAFAEKRPVTIDTSFLRQYAETRRFSAGQPAGARLTSDGNAVVFLRSGARSAVQTLFVTDVKTGQTHELLTPDSLLHGAQAQLSTEEKARLERMRISARGFTGFQLSPDGRTIVVTLAGKLYQVDRTSGRVTGLHAGEGVIDPKFSPDGRLLAYVRQGDLYVLDLAPNTERRLTTGATATKTHGLAEFVAQEEMDRYTGYWWSPDSKSIAYEESDTSGVEQFAIVDPMHPERSANTFRYPRPGHTNAKVRLGVVGVNGGKTSWAQWDEGKYPYLTRVMWDHGGPLAVLVMNRAQTDAVLLKVEARSGKSATLVTEHDDAWINLPRPERGGPELPVWLHDGSGFLWFTERNGAPEIELRKPDGSLAQSWVKPDAGFGALVGVTPDKVLYFVGSTNPTETVLWRVKLGGAPERVNAGDTGPAMQAAQISKDGQTLLVSSASLEHRTQTAVYSADGQKRAELPSVAEPIPAMPKPEIRKVGPGEGFWSALYRPRNFKAGTKLPVIVEVYAGPHAQQVHQSMDPLLQWIADQGFLVATFDGRGTPRRGRAWERAIKGDFAGVNLDDQVSALKALGGLVPEMDMNRVGIFGWSFGGYMSAIAVMKRGDVYKSGVAGAPVIDWHDYDTFYTERYLGVPPEAEKAYDVSSVLTYVPKLDRPLLNIHGTADDNVYFFHSLKLADAVFRAGKVGYQFLPLANFTHMVPDPLVTERLYERVVRQFLDTL